MIKSPLRGSVPERTPEHIAIIALQSLLEARETHIEELEVLLMHLFLGMRRNGRVYFSSSQSSSHLVLS